MLGSNLQKCSLSTNLQERAPRVEGISRSHLWESSQGGGNELGVWRVRYRWRAVLREGLVTVDPPGDWMWAEWTQTSSLNSWVLLLVLPL